MKTPYFTFLMILLMSAWILASCTDTTTNADEDAIEDREEVLSILVPVIGEALSAREEGFISSVYDLTATVEEDRIRYPNEREWRRPNNDWHYSYNPENGVHQLGYRRGMENEGYSRFMQVLLRYVFQDALGGFIEFPAEQSAEIETVRFRGSRSGESSGPNRQNEFERTASWFVEGFNNSVMSLNGSQKHSGSMTVSGREGRMMRMYQMDFDLVDISIERPADENDLAETLVSGVIEYQVTIRSMAGDDHSSNTYSGTIELENGTALLRVMGFDRVFNIDLETGDRVDNDPRS